ncbi:MAG TPA: DUF2076 domain-containing protein [Pseudolabrys sp.]|jgi:hypothetical protein|nr:DUF2076 domain-containing protein [Pseudolabrys sp.]
MTPLERQMVDDLFDRLTRLESAPRDPAAERAIAEGLARAPHAIYPLVQTVLVQDEALKRADARIRELAGEEAGEPASGGFLDSMRQALTGRASVPGVRPNASTEPDLRWNRGGSLGAAASPASGGSFLGTAAASAAGVIGGALLLNSISSMFGHHGSSAFAAIPPAGLPWDGNAAGSDLARDAGFNDIGSGTRGDAQPAGLFDDDGGGNLSDPADDFGNDFGGDFGGGDSA